MEVALLANMVKDESWAETQGNVGTNHRHISGSGIPGKGNFKYKSPSSWNFKYKSPPSCNG